MVKKVFSFFLELHQSDFLDAFCIKTKDGKISIFHKNHGLTPLEKCKFTGSFKSIFFYSKMASFSSRTSSVSFNDPYCTKTRVGKYQVLDKNHGKMQILGLF